MAKKLKSKAEKVHENHGITGAGIDYTVYNMNARERLVSMTAGALVGFVAGYFYFNLVIIGIIVGVVAGWKAIDIYHDSLFKKRQKELRIQFRDMLESLSNSLTVGMTPNRAFHSAYKDMLTEHGDKAFITKELQLICAAHDNNGIEIKDLVNDFAIRSGLEDIKSFAGVFDVSTNLGGDIAKVIRETRDMIGEKIEVEMEIQTIVTGQRNQLNILAVMPLVVTVMMKAFNTGADTALTIIVKILALGLFVFAYWLGTKIVDIKV